MKQYRTLIFDLDGTLLYTLEDLTDSVNFALSKKGYSTRNIEEIRQFVGHGVYHLLERAVPTGCRKEEIDATFAIFSEHYAHNCNNKTRPYDGIMDVLKAAKKEGYQLAIVSNKTDSAVKLLNELYFKEFISVAIGATDTIAKKPAPDTVFSALEELHMPLDGAVYIGDSEVDVQTARNASLPCIAVSWGFRDEKELEEAGATTIIRKPSELRMVLEQ